MRKLVCFAVPFTIAVLLCAYCLPLQWVKWFGMIAAVLSLLCCLLKGNLRKRGLFLTVGAAFGFLWFFGWTAIFVGPADSLAGKTDTVTAVVLDYPLETQRGSSINVGIEREGRRIATRLYAEKECLVLEPGDRLNITADFSKADKIGGEESDYYTSRGVFLIAYAKLEGVTWEKPEKMPVRYLPRLWSRTLIARIDEIFPAEQAALLRAILLGDKTRLSSSTATALRRTGMSHLAVVSGLHVSILLGGLAQLLQGRRRLMISITLPVLFCFILMVGCTPSAVRAAVMNGLVMLAPLANREDDPPTTLFVALMLLLLQNPYAAANLSLQLSFLSVAGISVVTQAMCDWLETRFILDQYRPQRVLLKRVWDSLSVTLGAMVFTVPVIAVQFRTVSIVAPLANLLCLWTGPLIFLGGFLTAVTGLFAPGIASLLAVPVGLFCRYLLWILQKLNELTFASVGLDTMYYRFWLIGVYIVIGCIFLGRKQFRSPVIPVCSAAITFGAAVFFTKHTLQSVPLTITALDVGQGSSTAFLSEGSSILVDCGGNQSSSAGDIAADYFQTIGQSRLDLLVFTHLDSDHCNGAEDLFARMEVQGIALPDCEDTDGRRTQIEALAQKEGAEIYYVTEILDVTAGVCTMTLYPPLGSGRSNEAGLFALCTMDEFDVLITGDADSTVEERLVLDYMIPDIEVLVVGHHGSKNSTSEEFLAAVKPEYALISSGYNTYGHPAQETLNRLTEAGATIYRTDFQGNITLRADRDGTLET